MTKYDYEQRTGHTLDEMPEGFDVRRFIIKDGIGEYGITAGVYISELEERIRVLKTAFILYKGWLNNQSPIDGKIPDGPFFFLSTREYTETTMKTLEQNPEVIEVFDKEFTLTVEELTVEEKIQYL